MALWVLIGLPPAAADRVFLTNGRVLEGVVQQLEGGRIEIVSSLGTLKLASQQVERIEHSETVEEEVERYLSETDVDAETLYRLALDCSDRGAETLEPSLSVRPGSPR